MVIPFYENVLNFERTDERIRFHCDYVMCGFSIGNLVPTVNIGPVSGGFRYPRISHLFGEVMFFPERVWKIPKYDFGYLHLRYGPTPDVWPKRNISHVPARVARLIHFVTIATVNLIFAVHHSNRTANLQWVAIRNLPWISLGLGCIFVFPVVQCTPHRTKPVFRGIVFW